MEDFKKKYIEAVSRAASKQNTDKNIQEVIEYIFPELKCSENEKIRAEIIEYVSKKTQDTMCIENRDKWVKWLKSKAPIEPQFPHFDDIVDKVFGTSSNIEYNEALSLVELAKKELTNDFDKFCELTDEDKETFKEIKANFMSNQENMTPALERQYERFFAKLYYLHLEDE